MSEEEANNAVQAIKNTMRAGHVIMDTRNGVEKRDKEWRRREFDSGSTPGYKEDKGKPRMELLPPSALVEAAKVFTFGAVKYDPILPDGRRDDRTSANNWRQGMRWGRTYGAMQRHLQAWWDGEDLDPESGESHLSHALCCLMMLSEYEQKKEFHIHDDRPYRGREADNEIRINMQRD
jgi:hypothetical protein